MLIVFGLLENILVFKLIQELAYLFSYFRPVPAFLAQNDSAFPPYWKTGVNLPLGPAHTVRTLALLTL